MEKGTIYYQLTSFDGKIEGEIFRDRNEAIENQHEFTTKACKLLVILHTNTGLDPVIYTHILAPSKYGVKFKNKPNY